MQSLNELDIIFNKLSVVVIVPMQLEFTSKNIINEAILFLDDLETRNEEVDHIRKELFKLSSEEKDNPMRVWFTIYQKFINKQDKFHKKLGQASFAYIIKYLQASNETPANLIYQYITEWERIRNKSYASVLSVYEKLLLQLPFNEQENVYWHWRFLFEALMQKVSGDIKIIVPTNALYLIYTQKRQEELKIIGFDIEEQKSQVPLSNKNSFRLLLILVVIFGLTLIFSFF